MPRESCSFLNSSLDSSFCAWQIVIDTFDRMFVQTFAGGWFGSHKDSDEKRVVTVTRDCLFRTHPLLTFIVGLQWGSLLSQERRGVILEQLSEGSCTSLGR